LDRGFAKNGVGIRVSLKITLPGALLPRALSIGRWVLNCRKHDETVLSYIKWPVIFKSYYDKVVKSQKNQMIVIPAPFCNGVNSSRNPVISDNYKNTGHRFSPVRRPFTKPSLSEIEKLEVFLWIH
jgi:hypothetical protein